MPSISQAARAVSDVLGDGGGIDQVVQREGTVDQEHGDSGKGDGVDQMQSHGRESFREITGVVSDVAMLRDG